MAARLSVHVTPALVKELVGIQLKEGICAAEQDAYARAKLASEYAK